MSPPARARFEKAARPLLEEHGFRRCGNFFARTIIDDLRLTIGFNMATRSSMIEILPIAGISCDRVNGLWSELMQQDTTRCFPLLTRKIPVNNDGGVIYFIPNDQPLEAPAKKVIDNILPKLERFGKAIRSLDDVIRGIERGWSGFPEYHLPIALRLVGDERRAREIVTSHLAAIPRHVDPATYREFGRRFLESGTTSSS